MFCAVRALQCHRLGPAPPTHPTPSVRSGEVRFGDISQVSFAFHRIEGALSYIGKPAGMPRPGRHGQASRDAVQRALVPERVMLRAMLRALFPLDAGLWCCTPGRLCGLATRLCKVPPACVACTPLAPAGPCLKTCTQNDVILDAESPDLPPPKQQSTTSRASPAWRRRPTAWTPCCVRWPATLRGEAEEGGRGARSSAAPRRPASQGCAWRPSRCARPAHPAGSCAGGWTWRSARGSRC